MLIKLISPRLQEILLGDPLSIGSRFQYLLPLERLCCLLPSALQSDDGAHGACNADDSIVKERRISKCETGHCDIAEIAYQLPSNSTTLPMSLISLRSAVTETKIITFQASCFLPHSRHPSCLQLRFSDLVPKAGRIRRLR